MESAFELKSPQLIVYKTLQNPECLDDSYKNNYMTIVYCHVNLI